MPNEINWNRLGYTSRVDALADEIPTFVAMVLETIDEDAAKALPEQWALVCRFFTGCARAARAQGKTSDGGGRRTADYLEEAFPCEEKKGSNEGFYEFMDWLSKAEAFRPTRLRRLLERT